MGSSFSSYWMKTLKIGVGGGGVQSSNTLKRKHYDRPYVALRKVVTFFFVEKFKNIFLRLYMNFIQARMRHFDRQPCAICLAKSLCLHYKTFAISIGKKLNQVFAALHLFGDHLYREQTKRMIIRRAKTVAG